VIEFHKPHFQLKEFKIEVTYRCELNCIHCSSDARPSNLLEISYDDCLRILKEAEMMGTKAVAFSGGEPLLWPNIFDVVQAAVKHGMSVTIYSSGNTEEFKTKAAHLHDLGTTKIIFSLFGSNSTTHERTTRKVGSFERTLEAIKDTIQVGLHAEIHFVPMSDNYNELTEIASLANGLGASRISVLRLVPQGRAALVERRALNRVQNLQLARRIRGLRSKYGKDFIRTGSPYNFLLLNDNPACCAAIDRLIIAPDLKLYPCDAFKRIDSSELVGTEDFSSLVAGSSLSDCWNKSPYLEAVRNYLTTDFREPCNSCQMLEKCLSGCLAQKAIANGSLEKHPDPDCLGINYKGDIA